MSNLHRIAKAEAFERVPETCPDVYAASTKELFKMTKWVDTRFAEKLSDHERSEIAGQINATITNLLEAFKVNGSMKLRKALIQEIEHGLRLSLTQDRIERIEAGEDPESTIHSTASHNTAPQHTTQNA